MSRQLVLRSCLAQILLLAYMPSAFASTPSTEAEDLVFGGIVYSQAAKRAAMNAEDPRTVRMVYFLPNDRPFRAEVVDSMKAVILRTQAFFAEEMQRHGHGNLTFQFETDEKGEPLVHRVDGEHADEHYLDKGFREEVWEALGGKSPVEFLVIDQSVDSVPSGGRRSGGVAYMNERDGRPTFGTVVVPGRFTWQTAAHEIGHAFGLHHDFRDDEFIMSYGASHQAQLSDCAAEFLAVHPYLNSEVDLSEEAYPSTISLLSPSRYPAGSGSIPLRVRISASAGLHQVLLVLTTPRPHFAAGSPEIKACRSLSGDGEAVVEFEYDGLIPGGDLTSLSRPIVHPVSIQAIDQFGRGTRLRFELYQISDRHIATLEEAGAVPSLAFLPDGSLASASAEAGGKLWNLVTRETTAILGPALPVRAVAISPDGGTLASEHDGIVKLWEVATGTNTATLEGQPGDTRFGSIAFSPPDGEILAAVSGDSTIKLWDLTAGTRYADLDHASWVTSVAFSPDGTKLASSSGDGMVSLWNPLTGERIALLEDHAPWVGAVAFSPDGATLASQSGWDGLVRLWDLGTHRTVATIENCSWRQRHGLLARRGPRLRSRTLCQPLGRGHSGKNRLPRARRLGHSRRFLPRWRNPCHRNMEGARAVGCLTVAETPSP